MSHQEDLSADSIDSSYHVVPSGDWVLLPRALAEGHPLFGVLGWAKFLGLSLLVFSAIQLFFFVFNLLYIGESEPFTLIIMFIFLVLTFISGFQLLSQHQNFFDSMCAMIVLFAYINFLVLLKGIYSGIIILLYYMGFDKFVEPVSGNLYEIVLFSLQSIISIVICLIVASYIINSKRISVTFCHRILADDPYLH